MDKDRSIRSDSVCRNDSMRLRGAAMNSKSIDVQEPPALCFDEAVDHGSLAVKQLHNAGRHARWKLNEPSQVGCCNQEGR